jgi:hypothetical protein
MLATPASSRVPRAWRGCARGVKLAARSVSCCGDHPDGGERAREMVEQSASASVVTRAQKRWVLCCLRRSASSLRRRGSRRVKVLDKKIGAYVERVPGSKMDHIYRVSMYDGLVQPTVGEDGEPQRGTILGQSTWHVDEPGAGGGRADMEFKGKRSRRHRLGGKGVGVEAKRRG